MKLDDLKWHVALKCRTCGNDQFNSEYPMEDLRNAPDDAELKCAYCGSTTTKRELLKDSSQNIDAAIEDIAELAVSEITSSLRKAFK